MLNPRTHTPARLPEGHPPVLNVVVDTEEEFDWTQPFSRASTATSSIAAQSLIHEQVYDALGVVPTYVIDYPVASTPSAFKVLRRLMENGQCEIGTHLHPWVSPPHEEEVSHRNSYAGNLPAELEFAKLATLTETITANIGRAPQVFKAGRYGLGPNTAAALAKLGYKIDASIVPRTAFCGDGGPDFTTYDAHPFWFEVEGQRLLELPVTAEFCGHFRHFGPDLYPRLLSPMARKLRLSGIASRTRLLERLRLSPEGHGLDDLKRLAGTLVRDGNQVLSLTYHSPSLAPGLTPYVRNAADLADFLKRILAFLQFFREECGGVFMSSSQLHQLFSVSADH